MRIQKPRFFRNKNRSLEGLKRYLKRKAEISRRISRKRSIVSRLQLIDFISLLLLEPFARKIMKTFELERVFKEAGIGIHPLIYAARVAVLLMFSIILGISLILVGIYVYASVLLTLIVLIILGITIPIITFAFSLLYPISASSSRRHMTESELPFFAVYASFMARGNISLPRVFERFAELPLFRGMRKESRIFIRELKIYGRDPVSALEAVASLNPSSLFRDFIMGYTTILRVGGDVVGYLESKTEELFAKIAERIKSIIERMGLIVEIYMIISVVTTLSLFVLFVSAGGLEILGARGGLSNLFIGAYLYVALPLMSVITIFFAHQSLPKQPVYLKRTYSFLPYAVILSIISGFLSFIISRGYLYVYGVIDKYSTIGLISSISIALLMFSGATYVFYKKDVKTLKGINEKITLFLEDVSETRKVGLSPEKAIIQTIKKDYGPLTPVVRRIGVALSLGIDLETAVRKSVVEIRNWFARVMFRFLIDSIKVGGGSPEVLYSLARYSKSLAELESRLRTSLRTYVMLPYIASIMLAVSSIMFLMMILQAPSALGSTQTKIEPEAVYSFIAFLSIGIIINTWVMGFVAGKTAEMSLGEGLKHSFLLTLVSLLAIVISTLIYVNV